MMKQSRLIEYKEMLKFIRNFKMRSIPQSVFYRKVHENHKDWSDESIATCLRFLDERSYIHIGKKLEIIPLDIPEKQLDILDEFDDQMKARRNERTCPSCHSINIKNVKFNQAKCMKCGLIGLRRKFNRG